MANCIMYDNWETSVRVFFFFFKIGNEIRSNKEKHHFPKSEITRTKSFLNERIGYEYLNDLNERWNWKGVSKGWLNCSVRKKFCQWVSFHSVIEKSKIKWRRKENLIEFLNVILISSSFSITRIFFGNEFNENSVFLHRSNAIISHDEDPWVQLFINYIILAICFYLFLIL